MGGGGLHDFSIFYTQIYMKNMCSENASPSLPPDAFNSKGFYINYIARILNYIFFLVKSVSELQ